MTRFPSFQTMTLKELFSSDLVLTPENVLEAAKADTTIAGMVNGWRRRLRDMPFTQACGEVQFFVHGGELTLDEFKRLREMTRFLRGEMAS